MGKRAADFAPDKKDLNPIEIASRDEIAALQLRRMKWSLKHAYENVSHYKKAFDAAGVHPGDLKDLSDLRKFPLTSKDDLRANYPYGMFAVPMDKIVRIHASSGTTGKPTVVGYTKLDIRTWADVCARSIYASGGRPGMKIHNAYGYGLFTGGLGIHYGAEKLGCVTIPISGGMTERQVKLLVDFEPELITVTPSYIGNSRRISGPEDRPAHVVTQGRHLRRRALDQCDARRDRGCVRHACGRHLRALRGDGAGGSQRVRRDQGWPACLGGSFLSGGNRSRDGGGVSGR